MSRQLRIVLVDDSAVVRRAVATLLGQQPDFVVVGQYSDGQSALDALPRLGVDAVVLDVEMPGLDGIATLKGIRRFAPRLPVVMFSSLTSAGASSTVAALMAGASDYVTKPQAGTGTAAESVLGELAPKLRALCGAQHPSTTRPPIGRAAADSVPPPFSTGLPARAPRRQLRPQVLVIGSSTGGPGALTAILKGLPRLAIPVVIVQHMPPLFTKMLAERLGHDTQKDVRELTDGEGIMSGRFYVAPGGHHTTIERRSIGVTARLDDRAPLHSVKPAVDYLFESAAAVFGGATLGCVLTGMGTDGANGAAAIQKAGGLVVVQDRATSAVWGMPGAVVRAGNADAVVPIEEMATALLNAIEGRRPNPREAISHGA